MNTALLLSASLLGLLAFFEPCTIATHTLFSARAHQTARRGCCRSLMAVWLARSALCCTLLLAVVALTPAPSWPAWLPSLMLSLMATLYLVSRFAYLPVPHLAFARVLPGGQSLPFAIQLGLTLPACTLPLFVVVAGLAAAADSLLFALLAGLLFASFFTAPLVFASLKGVHADGRDLLARAAEGSPYLTALLLFATALVLLLPGLDLSAESLKATLQQAGPTAIGLWASRRGSCSASTRFPSPPFRWYWPMSPRRRKSGARCRSVAPLSSACC